MNSMRAMLLAVMVVGCVTDGTELEQPDAGVGQVELDDAVQVDGRELAGDGFGFSCHAIYQPNQLGTECTTSAGEVGWCAIGICRPKCANETTCSHTPGAGCCPTGMRALPTVGGHCWCEPTMCMYGGGDVNCRAVDFAP